MSTRTRELYRDPETKKVVLHHYEDMTGVSTVETIQDVTELIEYAKAMNNLHGDYRRFSKGDWHYVATVPLPILMDLKQKGILDDPAAFKRWLNNRDNRAFRAMPGVL